MAITDLTFNKASTFLDLAKNVAPGATANLTSLQPAVQSLVANDPTKYQPSPEGAQALQLRAQGQYSNKQIITPVKYQINVEGTFITVDQLGKRIVTDNNMPYREIKSLSATTVTIKSINDPRALGETRSVKASPSVNAARQMFDTGTNAITNSLGNRFTQYSSQILDQGSKAFTFLQTGNAGALQSVPGLSEFKQSISKLPGLSVATNAAGQIPGLASRLPNLTNTLANPVDAATGLLGKAATGLNLQAKLPSADLGSLTDVFGAATDIFHNGPPTSLTGIISLEKQVKGIICNFKLPNITMPSFDSLTDVKFPKPSDLIKQLKKAVEDEISNIVNKLDIREQLKKLMEELDPEKLYNAAIKEITSCDNSPNADKNKKSGKSSS